MSSPMALPTCSMTTNASQNDSGLDDVEASTSKCGVLVTTCVARAERGLGTNNLSGLRPASRSRYEWRIAGCVHRGNSRDPNWFLRALCGCSQAPPRQLGDPLGSGGTCTGGNSEDPGSRR